MVLQLPHLGWRDFAECWYLSEEAGRIHFGERRTHLRSLQCLLPSSCCGQPSVALQFALDKHRVTFRTEAEFAGMVAPVRQLGVGFLGVALVPLPLPLGVGTFGPIFAWCPTIIGRHGEAPSGQTHTEVSTSQSKAKSISPCAPAYLQWHHLHAREHVMLGYGSHNKHPSICRMTFFWNRLVV